MFCRTCFIFLCVFLPLRNGVAQQKKSKGPVYIDKRGAFRWAAGNREATFFGVNYTTPFAHAYRAHKARGINPEDAIRADVYHMARLGLNAFRVHVWDTEISDKTGNLVNNDHLRLFDFLIAELKKRQIKIIVTPIAFWGNGYPEPDESTSGFSQYYGRGSITTNDSAILAQENFLKQFFTHINPYTALSYTNDPDVIAVEINNEPWHKGPKAAVTAYVNRLASAIKATGWRKPIFYNISQNPYYADAIAASGVDGFSFQWYPSGLVSGAALKGNYLPHVDKYTIPFDTIPSFRNRGIMVYEFDAADINESYMYPAMARSFREAGVGWATQFAYDPMALGDVNTEYQTHYLNLAYTPSKAISLLIASQVFHRMRRFTSYGAYPNDSIFDVFRVSYKQDLSEMNTDKSFFYSNSTATRPVNPGSLLNIAGVGSSPLVKYEGSGAYFIDKIEEGVWRLEVMPDAVVLRDPFEKASPKKEVTRIVWGANAMQLKMPDLGSDFEVKAVNPGNTHVATAVDAEFAVYPGAYLVSRQGKNFNLENYNHAGTVGLNEFVAPKPSKREIMVYHKPFREVAAHQSLTLKAQVVGLDSGNVSVLFSPLGGRSRSFPMLAKTVYTYEVTIPEEILQPGLFNYRIVVNQNGSFFVYPGNTKENPNAWDSQQTESWSMLAVSSLYPVELYNPGHHRIIYTQPAGGGSFLTGYSTGETPGQLLLRLDIKEAGDWGAAGFQFPVVDALLARLNELNEFKTLVVRMRGKAPNVLQAKISLINVYGQAFSAHLAFGDNFQDIEIPIERFRSGASLLLPRPFPGFLPLHFNGGGGNFRLSEMVKGELTLEGNTLEKNTKKITIEVERIWLKK
jgi:hypothetical protein